MTFEAKHRRINRRRDGASDRQRGRGREKETGGRMREEESKEEEEAELVPSFFFFNLLVFIILSVVFGRVSLLIACFLSFSLLVLCV